MQKTNTLPKFATAVFAAVAAIGLMVGLSGCSAQTVDMETVTAVIDVRTPEEVATGYLEGAVLIDWNSPTFIDEVSKLDPAGTYVIYCRSGNRAGQAISAMEELGFTNLTNAGSIAEAAELTGLPIVP
jgi:rhodanese-related sulfurtransferase